jgi:hypothetical protein
MLIYLPEPLSEMNTEPTNTAPYAIDGDLEYKDQTKLRLRSIVAYCIHTALAKLLEIKPLLPKEI